MTKTYGPQVEACDQIHATKYRMRGESFREAMQRVAAALSDNEAHYKAFRDILLEMRFMPGGRIQAAIGSTRITTPYNCFVSGTIEDSYTRGHGSIMSRATEAADTMRLGGGIGYDFSTLRPRGELIRSLQSLSSGPVSFMDIFDAVGRTTASSGHRRGAEMGVLRIDHPDIEEFVKAKQNKHRLTGFNVSVAVTDEFMNAVKYKIEFPLRWKGKIYRMISAENLWESIMRSNYDWCEPGVLFIDTINRTNNLNYCETIAATNPCGEQPLPPYGACLLGSFNLVKYLERDGLDRNWKFNYQAFFSDIHHVVRAMDNVVDRAKYPLHEQEQEARNKRRMGLGVTGVANAIEALGEPYASKGFISILREILSGMKNVAYQASALLAKEKGVFPSYDQVEYNRADFIQSLRADTQATIERFGMRNSHLLSIAPTGTISLAADNISSGIEPVYSLKQKRTIIAFSGPFTTELDDYGFKYLQTKGKTVEDCTPEDHLSVLIETSHHVDSAVSKTCNVPEDIPWEKFKSIYFHAWENGVKGCTTARKGNLRGAILESLDEQEPKVYSEPSACALDPVTGRSNCE